MCVYSVACVHMSVCYVVCYTEHVCSGHKPQRHTLCIVSMHGAHSISGMCDLRLSAAFLKSLTHRTQLTKVLSPACFSGECLPENLGRSVGLCFPLCYNREKRLTVKTELICMLPRDAILNRIRWPIWKAEIQKRNSPAGPRPAFLGGVCSLAGNAAEMRWRQLLCPGASCQEARAACSPDTGSEAGWGLS